MPESLEDYVHCSDVTGLVVLGWAVWANQGTQAGKAWEARMCAEC